MIDALTWWQFGLLAAAITFVVSIVVVRIASHALDRAAVRLDRRRRRIDNRTINQYRVTPMFDAGKGDAK